MGQENGTGRTEPSFGEDEALTLEDNQVDLDRLLSEIDQSTASSTPGYATDITAHSSDALTATIDADEMAATQEQEALLHDASPRQPHLDFGEIEEVSPYETGSEQAGYPTTQEISNGDESMSRGVLMVGGALAALGVLLGASGIYVGYSASSRIDTLQQNVDALQEKLATALLTGDPRVGQLQAEQAGLVSRIDEMALKMDTLAAQKSSDPRVAELDKRLDALERKGSAKTQASTTQSSGSGNKGSVATTTKPVAGKGDWAVILLSTASVTQADSERTRLQKMGYQADVIKSQSDGKLLYQVRVLGYASQEAAKAAIPAIEKKSGIHGAKVAKK